MRIPHSGSDRFRPSPLTSGTPTVTDAFKRCQLQPPFSEPERRRTRSASLANLERSSCCACLPVGPRAGDLRVARYGGRTVALSVARSEHRWATLSVKRSYRLRTVADTYRCRAQVCGVERSPYSSECGTKGGPSPDPRFRMTTRTECGTSGTGGAGSPVRSQGWSVGDLSHAHTQAPRQGFI